MINKIEVVNGEGILFNVTVEKEFGVDVTVLYDARYTEGFTELGQKVIAIPVCTMKTEKSGFQLQRHVPQWRVSTDNVRDIQERLLG